MISVCIPLFNFDASPLIRELIKQIDQLDQPAELILIDDASEEKYREIYRTFADSCRYIELEKNVGRAKIRNLFLQYASYPYLLFLDCDALIISDQFLEQYLNLLDSKPQIVCGGRVYPPQLLKGNKKLRWKYGHRVESEPAWKRKENPNSSFMTNNFLISKALLEQVQFDEQLTQYGHEDTLFGLQLLERGVSILHIENPILNGDIETNPVFLEKTKQGVENLYQIYLKNKDNPHLVEQVRLLRVYEKVKKWKFILNPIGLIINPLLLFLLKNGNSSIFLFNLYKLFLFMQQSK
ncbi:MAG: glycosyltransferase family 2 protein [Bacteroidales bacterium]|jgi:glycosyltransferase involved in cell wall biosynthesis